jgi:hypothetical protein
MVLMEQAKEMKNSLTAVEDEIKRSTGGRGMNKLLTVCEVCGVKIEVPAAPAAVNSRSLVGPD